jgi:hypothetical protein
VRTSLRVKYVSVQGLASLISLQAVNQRAQGDRNFRMVGEIPRLFVAVVLAPAPVDCAAITVVLNDRGLPFVLVIRPPKHHVAAGAARVVEFHAICPVAVDTENVRDNRDWLGRRGRDGFCGDRSRRLAFRMSRHHRYDDHTRGEQQYRQQQEFKSLPRFGYLHRWSPGLLNHHHQAIAGVQKPARIKTRPERRSRLSRLCWYVMVT